MKPLERRLNATRRLSLIRISIDVAQTSPQEIAERLSQLGLAVTAVEVRLETQPPRARLEVSVRNATSEGVLTAINALATQAGVREIRSSVRANGPRGRLSAAK
jgi:hypothetical protein